MSEPFIEYQEVSGKVVEHVRFYNTPSSVPEVLIRFEDGTSLSLKLNVGLKVEGEYYRDVQGDIETLRQYDPLPPQ
jgi:hypothetical protein